MLKTQPLYKIKTNEKIKLVSLSTKNFVRICSIYFMVIFNGCASLSSSLTEFLNRDSSMPVAFKDRKVNEAEKYMAIYDLGGRITTHANFIELLKYIPDDLKQDRIYLTRTDYFSIGEKYKNLNKWDIALESGFIDGLLGKGLTISEKLDHIKPRNIDEFLNNLPMDAFYMHGIDLEDLNIIKNEFKSSILMNYQVVDFSDLKMSLTVYVRLINLNNMKILTSGIVEVEKTSDLIVKKEIDAFLDAFDIVKNINDFPNQLYSENINIGVLNTDILNISGDYSEKLSRKTISIENGIITGLIQNEKYVIDNPVIIEKTKGFKLKFPEVYKNIVFNTSPLLYEEWMEFYEKTGCNLLLAYRYLPDNGLYLKVIDVKLNGKIIYSKAFPFNGRQDLGIIANHDFIASQFLSGFDFEIFNNRKILIVDGNYQAVESSEYLKDISKFNAMNLAIEDGIVSALVSQKIDVFEKLKTVYLKRPWMYNDKIFNLNPLYLKDWDQLKKFGVQTLIVFQNLIPYEKLNYNDPSYDDVAVSVKVIDLSNGDIIALSGITNIE